MAGAGWRDFVAGEVLTAANVQDYLQDQAVMAFASSAARGSAIASPTDGMVSYLKDTDTLERYNGSSWVVAFPIGNGGTGATDAKNARVNLSTGYRTMLQSHVEYARGAGQVLGTGYGFITNNGFTYNETGKTVRVTVHITFENAGSGSARWASYRLLRGGFVLGNPREQIPVSYVTTQDNVSHTAVFTFTSGTGGNTDYNVQALASAASSVAVQSCFMQLEELEGTL